MAGDDRDEVRAPRYDAEDVSPTTPRELRGWYCTGIAAEIFAVCGVGSFAPVLLEQLARESGVLRSDGKTPCVQPKTANASRDWVQTLFARAVDVSHEHEANQCVIRPFGKDVATTSFALYTFSTAVFVLGLVLISFSSVADYGTYRKRLLLSFAFTGASVTMAMALVWPQAYLLCSLLTIVAVVCLGSTNVLQSSYLPLLASYHPKINPKQMSGFDAEQQPERKSTSPELRVSTQISSSGVGLGYAGAVSVQIFCIFMLVLLKNANLTAESTPLRFVLLLVGLFWFSLTLPGAIWLRERPGPPLRAIAPWKSRLPIALQYIKFAWSSVGTTIKTATQLRQVRVFLIAWFLLSDGIATVSGIAILFARTELQMETVAIALLSITVTASGIFGAFVWPLISRRFQMESRHTILACIIISEIVPLYGILGFVPLVKSWGVFGLQQPWEIYPLGFIFGFVMGGFSSYCRALYGHLIPPGSEAAFYALGAITDKGSSAVGPAIVGVIADATGTLRPAFIFTLVLLAIPMPLFYIIDVEKGREDAAAMSKHLGSSDDQPIMMEDYDHVSESDAAEGLLRQPVENADNVR